MKDRYADKGQSKRRRSVIVSQTHGWARRDYHEPEQDHAKSEVMGG